MSFQQYVSAYVERQLARLAASAAPVHAQTIEMARRVLPLPGHQSQIIYSERDRWAYLELWSVLFLDLQRVVADPTAQTKLDFRNVEWKNLCDTMLDTDHEQRALILAVFQISASTINGEVMITNLKLRNGLS